MTSIEPLGDADVAPVVALISARQRDPSTHVVYLGEDAAGIAAELAAYDRWREQLLVARDANGEVTGALLADIEEARGRVWWIGPWTRDPGDVALAHALLDAQLDRHGAVINEQELAPDQRNTQLCALAEARGFAAVTGSAILSLELRPAPDGPDGATPARTLPLRPADHSAVIALHDELFPGTHTLGRDLVVADRTEIRVQHRDGAVVGYIAYEVSADGTGYLDFLGVPVEHRRQGLAERLVRDAIGDLAARGVPSVHLTVRTDRPGARALYAGIGFTEERVIAPYRLGFPPEASE